MFCYEIRTPADPCQTRRIEGPLLPTVEIEGARSPVDFLCLFGIRNRLESGSKDSPAFPLRQILCRRFEEAGTLAWKCRMTFVTPAS
jgi:hypothetical protein